MMQETGVTAVAHVIQLAVAPVFLLSAIGAMLAVMTNRLARIVDRARTVERDVSHRGVTPDAGVIAELGTLSRRAKLIHHAITLCTVTALLICAVIAVLFLGAFLDVDASRAVGLLFVAAMLAFFLGLLLFLREIFLATATVRIGILHVPRPPIPPGGNGPSSPPS
ncbi:MAG: DUF2721 domain-containing protein [Gemmatimonadaceae bacterium]